jgi:hypothetical protein
MACLLALSGCSTVNLNKLVITSMNASLPKGPDIAPGEKRPLLVSMTQPNGKSLATGGESDEKISWEDLSVTASVVNFSKGNVSLPRDPRISDGKVPHVAIIVPSHPDLHADLDIPVAYNRQFKASYEGSSGFNGNDGTNGTNGMNGSMGSIDPNKPSAGGDGGNGTAGTDGSDGKPGDDGPHLDVRVALRPGDHPLLQVSVLALGKEEFFLVDPQGGSLLVTSAGGSGGRGGRGGQGGSGGSGGAGSPPGRSGNNGSNGRDGFAGSDGRGGSISVRYDPQAKPFLSAIHFSNPGGPPPILNEQPVAALW